MKGCILIIYTNATNHFIKILFDLCLKFVDYKNMGMFDRIFVEVKLPLPKAVENLKINWKKEEFQTKDLDNLMHTYRISKSGRLMFLDQKTEWVKDDSRFGGYINVISECWLKSKHTGKVFFYTTVCSNPEQKESDWMELVDQDQIDGADGFDYGLDFEAKFVDGVLKTLKLAKLDKYPIKDYLINHNKWVEEIKKKQAKLSYKIKNFLRNVIPNKGYYKAINYLNKFVELQTRAIRKLY
jgi:hypothetical protein